MQGTVTPRREPPNAGVRTWLSPGATGSVERLAYAVVGTVLLLVGFGGFALVLLSWSVRDLLFGLFGLVMGLLAFVLAYRMLFAAATGRRLYWWSGQRDYDERGTR